MGVTRIGRRALRVAAAFIFSAVWIALLLIPVGSRTGEAGERYSCLWSDGTQTQLGYEDAYRALAGIDGSGNILLAKGDTSGTVSPSAAFSAAEAALRSGGLAELLSVSAADAGRLERAALWREYGGRAWYGGGFFVWSGERVERANTAVTSDMVLLSGSISAQTLKNTGATRLELRGNAQISASALIGTAVSEIVAEPPYAAESGAVYLDASGGRRLIAGVPAAEYACVSENDFADRGALLPCSRLKELTLDFLGGAKYASEDESPMLAYLFQG
ncbi:MAG: hypothetical protein K2H43_00225, partial [Clostridia bacterium]|nr:hypothetical protein [Clostridia bacterium]